ncbi:MAG: sugar phosphate isomerase/epimerase [Oscillospiraceae bacterium]|nr:sugar phosphate isomerase/epimerase [Oscillospiraceae bacterium]
MRIGLYSGDIKRINADNLFAKIAKYGFASTQLGFADVTETNFDKTGQFEIPSEIDDGAISVIKESSEKHGVEIIACNATFNAAHPNPEIRIEGIKRFEATAIAVQKLGCKIVSVCSGTRCREHLWTYHPDNSSREAWDDMTDTLKKCVKIAERYNIIMAIETEVATIIDTPEKARDTIDEIGSENLKMIMDCANLFHAGEAKKENVSRIINHAFDIFGKDIILAHGKDIAESDGVKFCPTGEGIVDYKQFIQLLNKYNYNGDIILHGIFDESKMSFGYQTIKRLL